MIFQKVMLKVPSFPKNLGFRAQILKFIMLQELSLSRLQRTQQEKEVLGSLRNTGLK